MARGVELVPVLFVFFKRNVRVDGECHLDGSAICQKALEAVHGLVRVGHVLERIVEHDDVKFARHFVDCLLENLNAVFVRDIFLDERVATGEALDA